VEHLSFYLYSLVDAVAYHCNLDNDNFTLDTPAIEARIDELIAALQSPDTEIARCRVVSHLTTKDRGRQLGGGPKTATVPEASLFSIRDGSQDHGAGW
jgi:hypothetical protein